MASKERNVMDSLAVSGVPAVCWALLSGLGFLPSWGLGAGVKN